jgi:hypothetical protein
MAVVQSLGDVMRGSGAGAGWGLRILPIAALAVLFVAPVVRAGDLPSEDAWVSPPSLDVVPIRSVDAAPIGVSAEAVAPRPIVVPLPTGLETGAAYLGTLAVARWWTRRRRA